MPPPFWVELAHCPCPESSRCSNSVGTIVSQVPDDLQGAHSRASRAFGGLNRGVKVEFIFY